MLDLLELEKFGFCFFNDLIVFLSTDATSPTIAKSTFTFLFIEDGSMSICTFVDLEKLF